MHRSERTAYKRTKREAARRAKVGIPPAPTPEQQVIAELLTTIAARKLGTSPEEE